MKQYSFLGGGGGGCSATLCEGKTLVPVSDEREEVICHKVSQGLLTEIVVVENAGPMRGGGTEGREPGSNGGGRSMGGGRRGGGRRDI